MGGGGWSRRVGVRVRMRVRVRNVMGLSYPKGIDKGQGKDKG